MAQLKFRYPATETVQPQPGYSAVVILLHGLGDSSDGWLPVAEELSGAVPHMKWILPTAPTRPITCNGGFRMTGWYDITDLSGINRTEDDEGVKDSATFIESLIAKEAAAGVPAERVVVAGFSQGGAMALMMMRSKLKLAGVVALSAYLPLSQEPVLVSPEMKSTPVFMAHGTFDNVVKFEYGKMSAEKLRELGCNVVFKDYAMAHTAHPAELQEVAAFISRVLPAR